MQTPKEKVKTSRHSKVKAKPSHSPKGKVKASPAQQAEEKPNHSKYSHDQNYNYGKSLRDKTPRESHASWKTYKDRPDPVELSLEAEKGRMPDLLPLRHGRMAQSPFTFYRGSALNMAADLSQTPNSGVIIQCCGDAHLMNFGGFATPERRVIMSINDLDETNPAPWEWDLKRLTTSFVIACRDNGLSEASGYEMAFRCVNAYRNYMREFSKMKAMELWYYALDADMLIASIKDPEMRRRGIKRITKTRETSGSGAQDLFPKMAESVNGIHRIKDQLPSIFHDKEYSAGQIQDALMEAFINYKLTLPPAYQLLLDHYRIVDAAYKVVGIGSVGTYCMVILLMDADDNPFFLQVKEARTSVLEKYAGKSVFENHGQRVVNGHRLMQPYSDIFLGWTRGKLRNRDFFVRQLRDMKIKFLVETFGNLEMAILADWCGHALALSHARSGDSAKLSGYMGKSEVFDEAIAKFSVAYADQNEKDFEKYSKAVKSGKIKAVFEEEKK